MSQANPLRLFVTHAWEHSDDYLRVFEYLESARNFFYRNYSTPDQRPSGDKEALREDLRRQIKPVEAIVALSSLGYGADEIRHALSHLPAEGDLEDQIRLALQELAGAR